jgi:hypothetical protein
LDGNSQPAPATLDGLARLGFTAAVTKLAG